jgi:hypothetical protein
VNEVVAEPIRLGAVHAPRKSNVRHAGLDHPQLGWPSGRRETARHYFQERPEPDRVVRRRPDRSACREGVVDGSPRFLEFGHGRVSLRPRS